MPRHTQCRVPWAPFSDRDPCPTLSWSSDKQPLGGTLTVAASPMLSAQPVPPASARGGDSREPGAPSWASRSESPTAVGPAGAGVPGALLPVALRSSPPRWGGGATPIPAHGSCGRAPVIVSLKTQDRGTVFPVTGRVTAGHEFSVTEESSAAGGPVEGRAAAGLCPAALRGAELTPSAAWGSVPGTTLE